MVEEIARPPGEQDVRDLAAALVDAVASGASVSFMASLTQAEAEQWWRETIAHAHPNAVFLVVRDDHGIAGTVQMHPAWPPNQPHRADIAKLLVHRRARGRGYAKLLMNEIEARAAAKGYTLLTLDTVPDRPADHLYRSAGWNVVGRIPNYALDPDGTPCDTVVFYKDLSGRVDSDRR
jgi:ribosomal protein S18 acetylase RimI-like enzyme